MEEQLRRIADSFESIARSLHWIQQEGLEIYSKKDCLRLSIDSLETNYPEVHIPNHIVVCLEGDLNTHLSGTQRTIIEPDDEKGFHVKLTK